MIPIDSLLNTTPMRPPVSDRAPVSDAIESREEQERGFIEVFEELSGRQNRQQDEPQENVSGVGVDGDENGAQPDETDSADSITDADDTSIVVDDSLTEQEPENGRKSQAEQLLNSGRQIIQDSDTIEPQDGDPETSALGRESIGSVVSKNDQAGNSSAGRAGKTPLGASRVTSPIETALVNEMSSKTNVGVAGQEVGKSTEISYISVTGSADKAELTGRQPTVSVTPQTAGALQPNSEAPNPTTPSAGSIQTEPHKIVGTPADQSTQRVTEESLKPTPDQKAARTSQQASLLSPLTTDSDRRQLRGSNSPRIIPTAQDGIDPRIQMPTQSQNLVSQQPTPPTLESAGDQSSLSKEGSARLGFELGGEARLDGRLINAGAPVLTPARIEMSQSIIRQMADGVRAQVTAENTVEISLRPAELGRVRISMSAADAGMVITVLAERAETLELMRKNIDDLARSFAEMGHENLSFNFEQSGSFEQDGDSPLAGRTPEDDSQKIAPPTEDQLIPTQALRMQSSGVDILM